MTNMKIVVDEEIVGELTEEGDIITDDITLQKLALRIKGEKFDDMRRRGNKGKLYFSLIKVGKGDKSYCSAVAELLLDEGYGLEKGQIRTSKSEDD